MLELQAQSPKLRDCRRNVTENCALNETAKGGDLRYVGAASTAPLAKAQGKPEEALLAFGVATWGNWYNLGKNTIPFVDIDTNGDGTADFETFATRLTDTDLLVASTVDLEDGARPSTSRRSTASSATSTRTSPTPTSSSCRCCSPHWASTRRRTRRASRTRSASRATTSRRATRTGSIDVIDRTLSFDPLKPGLWTQGGGDAALSYLAKPGTALVVNRDAAALKARQVRGPAGPQPPQRQR